MRHWLQLIGWLVCVVYSTIPAFWLMIHPFAERWRARHRSYRRSPYTVLLPAFDGDVGRGRVGHAAVAGRITVSGGLDLGRGSIAVRLRPIFIFTIREKVQRETTRRPAGSSWRKSRSATGDRWNPLASAASRIPGTSVRDAGMERRNRARGVLGADSIRGSHGSSDDPTGGCRTREAVRRLLPRLSPIRAGRSPASMGSAPAIIRFG
jgi:hypothetical protein